MIGVDQDAMARKCFTREIEGGVFIIVVANGEMPIDQAIKVVCSFKNPQLKKEFIETTDISTFRLFPEDDAVKAELGEATPENRSLA
jgi:predicted proteasome-type protease